MSFGADGQEGLWWGLLPNHQFHQWRQCQSIATVAQSKPSKHLCTVGSKARRRHVPTVARFSKALTQAGQGGGAAVRGVGHQALVHLLAAHTQALQARVWKGSAGFSGAELGRETAGYCRTNCQKSQASGPLARTQVWQANKTGRHKRRRQAYQPS